ncbi:hypothetical protein [Flavobacterium sp.]|uniref:hypothetical protein n=1 Tax=Flavobacterium sp. TaxID=239 RepID=UPI003752CFA5
MKYRIIVKTEKSGIKKYYIQKKIFSVFWIYLKEYLDITMYKYRTWFHHSSQAKEKIEKLIYNDFRITQSKVIKTEILK